MTVSIVSNRPTRMVGPVQFWQCVGLCEECGEELIHEGAGAGAAAYAVEHHVCEGDEGVRETSETVPELLGRIEEWIGDDPAMNWVSDARPVAGQAAPVRFYSGDLEELRVYPVAEVPA